MGWYSLGFTFLYFLQNNINEVEWLKNIKDLLASEEESELDLKLGDELDSRDKASVTPPNVTPTRSLSPAAAAQLLPIKNVTDIRKGFINLG